MPTREEKEELCGIGNCRPPFLQKVASKKTYIIVIGCLGIVQSMMGTYLSAMLSTLERRFGIKSKESAYLMSGNEISQIFFLFVMPFIIRVKKRPLSMAMALFCSGFGCLIMGLPYLISEEDYLEDFHKNTTEDFHKNTTNTTYEDAGMCGSDNHPSSLEKLCDDEGNRKVDFVGLALIFFGIVLTGVGNCFFYTFGLTYLDDNTSHESSPIWLSITFMFKLIGPILGFSLATFCLKTYDIPSKSVDFDEKDPKWIGAWWLGFPIIGFLIFLFSLPLLLFPQRLPRQNTDASVEKQKLNEEMVIPDKQGFKAALLRLLKNKLFMFNYVSTFFYVFAFKGFGTFMVKYIEYQFRKTASRSASFSIVGALCSAVGILLSGFIVAKCKPSARYLTGWNVVLGAIIFGWLILFGSIGCPTSDVYGHKSENGINITVPCNYECRCPVSRPDPICSKDGMTNFYSPCVAGCTGAIKVETDHAQNKDVTVYTECGCAVEAWEEKWENLVRESPEKEWNVEDYIHRDEATKGWCEVDCSTEWAVFMISVGLVSILVSTGRVGNILVALR